MRRQVRVRKVYCPFRVPISTFAFHSGLGGNYGALSRRLAINQVSEPPRSTSTGSATAEPNLLISLLVSPRHTVQHAFRDSRSSVNSGFHLVQLPSSRFLLDTTTVEQNTKCRDDFLKWYVRYNLCALDPSADTAATDGCPPTR